MDLYFNTFSEEEGFDFAVTSRNGEVSYHRMLFFEPPIDLKIHHVYAMPYYTSDNITEKASQQAKVVSATEVSYLAEAMERPFRWIPIDEESAVALRTLLASQGNMFNIPNENGTKTVRLMYAGPFSEELDRPEFQSMYNPTPEDMEDH